MFYILDRVEATHAMGRAEAVFARALTRQALSRWTNVRIEKIGTRVDALV